MYDTSNGCKTSVQLAGNLTRDIFSARAISTVAPDKWVKWPSERRRIGLTFNLHINF